MLQQQLCMSLSADPTPSPTPGTVAYREYDFHDREEDVEQALNDLLARTKDGLLHVLIDEAYFGGRQKYGPTHSTFVTRLCQSVPGLYLWAASVVHTDIPPELRPEPLTVPLRCAPSVLREITPAIERYQTSIHNYSNSGVPAPGDGLSVIRLSHHGNAHTGRWPVDCAQCGQDIAAELHRLGVGNTLCYRDVFVLTRSSDLQDDISDDGGRVVSPASPVVRGLRAAGLPVCVLSKKNKANAPRLERDLQDVALATTDRLTVAYYGYLHGMERRVVVVLSGRNQYHDLSQTDDSIEVFDRLEAASRCTTQLIMVPTPTPTTETNTTAATFAIATTTSKYIDTIPRTSRDEDNPSCIVQ
ncbi:hypothetical protein V1264_025036 [Littorina saxatilis]|uniref:Uncharacterized protein n=2 Tax=Littorina saxatilis TaxID=31220 RepID=A0AAN9ALV2_9CAEN